MGATTSLSSSSSSTTTTSTPTVVARVVHAEENDAADAIAAAAADDWDGVDWVLDAARDDEAASSGATSTTGRRADEDRRPRLIVRDAVAAAAVADTDDDRRESAKTAGAADDAADETKRNANQDLSSHSRDDKSSSVVALSSKSAQHIMTPTLAHRLARELPKDRVREWRLAFDSNRHGTSFRGAMLSRCQDIGPLVILIEPKRDDKSSAGVATSEAGTREVFIGHASPGVHAPRHDFAGDDFTRCWRFTPREGLVDIGSGSIAPALYCASGFTQYLNGLGFFGRVGRHCLFVDEHLESGHVGYGAREFQILRVEIWALTACERVVENNARRHTKHAHAKAQAALITQFTSSSIDREARDAARS